ncbi:unnamed protein product [Zymoseptoria tritici ST99CH_1A5]|uniref:Uncharacterized protein n=1 Tax=Zymoseptoria tritici ST99CH_1A5 TaxID=1276529 RepID=A0A1Y6LPQ0_ZYMTR|nr:unnamed protein product [Zymoseptoria tritici ST99CH_1A5]
MPSHHRPTHGIYDNGVTETIICHRHNCCSHARSGRDNTRSSSPTVDNKSNGVPQSSSQGDDGQGGQDSRSVPFLNQGRLDVPPSSLSMKRFLQAEGAIHYIYTHTSSEQREEARRRGRRAKALGGPEHWKMERDKSVDYARSPRDGSTGEQAGIEIDILKYLKLFLDDGREWAIAADALIDISEDALMELGQPIENEDRPTPVLPGASQASLGPEGSSIPEAAQGFRSGSGHTTRRISASHSRPDPVEVEVEQPSTPQASVAPSGSSDRLPSHRFRSQRRTSERAPASGNTPYPVDGEQAQPVVNMSTSHSVSQAVRPRSIPAAGRPQSSANGRDHVAEGPALIEPVLPSNRSAGPASRSGSPLVDETRSSPENGPRPRNREQQETSSQRPSRSKKKKCWFDLFSGTGMCWPSTKAAKPSEKQHKSVIPTFSRSSNQICLGCGTNDFPTAFVESMRMSGGGFMLGAAKLRFGKR